MQALALNLLGFHIAKEHGFADQLIGHRQTDPAGMIYTVEQIDPFDRTVLAMIIMPTDQVIFVPMRLGLDRVIDDEHPIVLLDVAHQRLDLLPQGTCCHHSRPPTETA